MEHLRQKVKEINIRGEGVGGHWCHGNSAQLQDPDVRPHPSAPCPHTLRPPGVLTPHSQVTLSRMVRSTIAPLLGNFTWQVSLVPWSWGRGVRVSTDEKGVLGPRELGAADVQEKMGGVARSQAQGTEQFRFPGRPGSRAPGLRTWGWWVSAGEWRGRRGIGRRL